MTSWGQNLKNLLRHGMFPLCPSHVACRTSSSAAAFGVLSAFLPPFSALLCSSCSFHQASRIEAILCTTIPLPACLLLRSSSSLTNPPTHPQCMPCPNLPTCCPISTMRPSWEPTRTRTMPAIALHRRPMSPPTRRPSTRRSRAASPKRLTPRSCGASSQRRQRPVVGYPSTKVSSATSSWPRWATVLLAMSTKHAIAKAMLVRSRSRSCANSR